MNLEPRLSFSSLSLFCVSLLTTAFVACGSSDEPEPEDLPSAPTVTIDFDLEDDRLLSTLTDEEIVTACEEMESGMSTMDAWIACSVVSVSDADSADACVDGYEACAEDPADALSMTTIRTTPAPIDCSLFSAELTVGCDHTVAELEDCANALAGSVIPSGDAISCEDTGGSLEAVEGAAKEAIDTGYVTICAPLLECEALVTVLLTGMAPDGLGGAGGSQ